MIVYCLPYNETRTLTKNRGRHIFSNSVILSSAQLFEHVPNLDETYCHYYNH